MAITTPLLEQAKLIKVNQIRLEDEVYEKLKLILSNLDHTNTLTYECLPLEKVIKITGDIIQNKLIDINLKHAANQLGIYIMYGQPEYRATHVTNIENFEVDIVNILVQVIS